LNHFRILCAVREGEYGVNGINRCAEDVLRREGLIEHRNDNWYRGCPIMITENEYGLSLFNGDTGIVWQDEEQDGAMAVFFEGGDTGLRKFNPSSLPAHEVVYALTVHKSQGSQFGHVLTVLPAEESPVVTRELLYTAVTRAESEAHVWATETILRQAVGSKTVRHSGLRDALAEKTGQV
jgi:exodeoxyribonuclease V alpha subunit